MPAADADARLARFRVVAANDLSDLASHSAAAEAHARCAAVTSFKRERHARSGRRAASVARDAAVSRLVRATSRNQRRVWRGVDARGTGAWSHAAAGQTVVGAGGSVARGSPYRIVSRERPSANDRVACGGPSTVFVLRPSPPLSPGTPIGAPSLRT